MKAREKRGMDPDDEHRGFQRGDMALVLRFAHYVRGHLGMVCLALLAMCGAGAAQVAGPYIVKLGIDQYILPGHVEELWKPAGLFLATLAAAFAFNFIQTTVIGHVGQGICLTLRDRLYAHLQRLPMRFFDTQPVGRTVTRLTNDVEALSELVASGVVAILSDIVLLAGIAGMMFWMDARIACLAFLFLPPLMFVTWLFRTKVRESFRTIRLKLARLNAFLNERVQGMRVIRAFNAESETTERHASVNADHYDAHMDSIRLFAVYNPLVDLIGTLSVAVLIGFAAHDILAGHLTFGELVAFLVYLEMFYKPIRDLAEKYNILQAALAAMEKVFGLMDEPAAPQAPNPVRIVSPLRGHVSLDRVTFAYGAVDVLHDVSFDVRPGETVAIVGATGAGKSTIASLLMGFYSPRLGQVFVDGVCVPDYDLPALRRRIGYVTQDPFLFSGTLAENITLGDPAVSMDAVRRAAESCGIAQSLDTRMMERGATYSAGERQLVAFARCLVFQPDLLLLDEATAAIDPITEKRLDRAFFAASAGRTSIVIAHRPGTVRMCGRILVLHQGKLVESGTHEDLLRKGGIYSVLFRLQEAA